MLTCRKATQLLSERLERELTFSEKLRLKIHVIICASCRKFGRQLLVMRLFCRQFIQPSKNAAPDQPDT